MFLLKYTDGIHTNAQWNQTYLRIQQGDIVKWTWSAPYPVALPYTYMVQQVADPSSTIPSANGFSSLSQGPASNTGLIFVNFLILSMPLFF